MQHLGQLSQGIHSGPELALFHRPLPFEVLPGVVDGKIHQLLPLASLGCNDLHCPAPLFRKPAAHHIRVVHRRLYQHLGGHLGSLRVELLDEGADSFTVAGLVGSTEHEVLGPDQLASAHHQHPDARTPPVSGNGDHVAVDFGIRNHPLLLSYARKRLELVAKLGGELKVEVGGRRVHAPLHALEQGVVLALEEQHYSIDDLAIVVWSHRSRARSHTGLDVVVEAWPARRRIRPYLHRALAQRKDCLEQAQGLAGSRHIGVRPEVAGAITYHSSGQEHPWVRLTHSDPDEGVGLVIAQPDVVVGHVLLYQVAFEHQSFELRGGDDVVDVTYVGC
ncbi:MAG: hypothetical protein BWY85_00867 [Firmicutes bacterium ADurb.Bin506]|nr:MAG: hypothetical protein BWY85_00867 [Firmicutes bacterium ADurb.Bin506]